MADPLASSSSPASKTRSKKQSTRIDMTPMVDLAFLLLTFFVLTAALTKSKALILEMPEDKPTDQPPISASRVLTVILDRQDQIYWYSGIAPRARVTNFSPDGIRKILLTKKKQIRKMYVLIKFTPNARYRNMVDILDELALTEIQNYAIVDLAPDDLRILKTAKTPIRIRN
jgi:biopolymer transport protein ExbD